MDVADVYCCVPFFGGDPFRIGNLERVLDHLRVLFGHDDVWVETGESQAQARNRARTAKEWDVLYFNDADSIVPLPQIEKACELAADRPGLVFAFSDYLREGPDGELVQHIAHSFSSGAVAISRECFENIGGYDERFVGWGYEDLEFAWRCQKRWPHRRVEGELRHLWHPPAGARNENARDLPITDEQVANLRLYEELVADG
jgi:hypothetical protein